MIIAENEIIYDNEEQKKEVEAETAKNKNDSETDEVFKEMKDYTEKYYKEI